MMDVFLDALLDSLKVLGIVFVLYFLFSFIEGKIAKKMMKANRFSTLLGSLIGLIPQCGFSVVSADLYLKRHITMGTLVAVFIACSDEAIPIFLSNPDKILMVFPLILVKVITGFIVGFVIDLILSPKTKEDSHQLEHLHDSKEMAEELDKPKGCCHHSITEEDTKESKLEHHLLHPLIHSLKIFLYVFAINLLFGFVIYRIGETSLENFLVSNRYLAPLFSVLIGLVPNCASSVVLSEIYLLGGISFGACVGGLCCNAGLGFVVLLKKPERIKETLIILGIVVVTGLFIGYGISFLFGF